MTEPPTYTSGYAESPEGMPASDLETLIEQLLGYVNGKPCIGGVVQLASKAADALASLTEARDTYADLYARRCAELARLERVVGEAFSFLRRYRNETPLGNQPHMIAHIVDTFLATNQKDNGSAD